MFCSKCGKKIDYDAVVCNECSGNQSFFVEDVKNPVVEEKTKTTRNLGLKNAISGAVLGYLALVFSICWVYCLIIGLILCYFAPPVGIGVIISAVSCYVVGLILSINSLKKGIRSIILARNSSPKPVATLVLGIVSVDCAAGSLIVLAMI